MYLIGRDSNSSYANPRESVLRASIWVPVVLEGLLQAKPSRRRIATWMGNHVVGGEAECAHAIPIAC